MLADVPRQQGYTDAQQTRDLRRAEQLWQRYAQQSQASADDAQAGRQPLVRRAHQSLVVPGQRTLAMGLGQLRQHGIDRAAGAELLVYLNAAAALTRAYGPCRDLLPQLPALVTATALTLGAFYGLQAIGHVGAQAYGIQGALQPALLLALTLSFAGLAHNAAPLAATLPVVLAGLALSSGHNFGLAAQDAALVQQTD